MYNALCRELRLALPEVLDPSTLLDFGIPLVGHGATRAREAEGKRVRRPVDGEEDREVTCK